jgi:hypothetical protein
MLQSILSTCIPRGEILGGELSEEIFAAKLKQVVEGTAPNIYLDPTTFFVNTYPTNGLKTLIAEVFGRLTGTATGSPVIRLETSFGGGKTHDEIALWHIAKNGRYIQGLDRFVDNLTLIPDRPIQVAAIACQDLDPVNGVLHEETGIKIFTLWGEIAYQIGGVEGYSLLKGSDQQRVSPGTVVLEKLTKGQPTLIILDEIAQYFRTTKAIPVGNSDLSKQVNSFLFALMDVAGSSNHIVFVYTLASSTDAFKDETEEIREAVSISSRQERVLSPSTDVEIYNIVKQRMFSSVDGKAAEKAAKEYLQFYRASRLNLPEGCKDGDHAKVIESSYPFLPELFDLLTKKIASIPNFQRTRGALRLFAMVIRHLWQHCEDQWIPMIHPHHIPIGVNDDVTSDLTSRLSRPLLVLPIQADIYNKDGKEAHAQIHDREWEASGKPPFSTWVARTIFLHSINQGIAAGIRKTELNLSLLTPGLESSFGDTVLERLISVAWYLDFDPITTIARFKEEPSINKIIAEEKQQVGRIDAKEDLRSRRDTIFADKVFKLVTTPESPSDVVDTADCVALCLIDFDDATIVSSTDTPPSLVEQIFNNTGESGKFRVFRNRLLFLLANRQELERAIDNAREYKAIQNILKSPNRLQDLSESQQKQLKVKSGEVDLAVRISLTNAYRHLFYPAKDDIKAPKGLLHFTLPAQDSSDVKGNKNQQDVILKVLKDCQKIRSEDALSLAPAYILQKVWMEGQDRMTTKALKETFAKDLNLNILLDAEVPKLRDTIRKGLMDGSWDMKVGDKVYIRDDAGKIDTIPDTIEFSDRMELYRRGILKLPEPRVIELSIQVMPSSEVSKSVRVKWRAQGSLSTSLYQDRRLIRNDFLPSDEYETTIAQTTLFKVLADYGNNEIAEKEAQANVTQYPTGSNQPPSSHDQTGIFQVKPEFIEHTGSLNSVFTYLNDRCDDYKVKKILSVEVSVDQVMDYRKLITALPLLSKLNFTIDQTVTIQAGEQFVRLIYQGNPRGFQPFMNPTNTLLGSADVKADVILNLVFQLEVSPQSMEMNIIKQALERNPVDKIALIAKVDY